MIEDASLTVSTDTTTRATGRPIVRVETPVCAQLGDHFSALRIHGATLGREADPFLALDHFRMAGPTFPPHAHAGFSAVTYVLPESAGAMLNRDGLGDRSLIAPGAIHWTAAGGGIVHEELPDRPGIMVEGFQIFVRQPVAQERVRPAIHHVEPHDVPAVGLRDGGSVRVLAGTFAGVSAQFEPPSPLVVLDATLPAGRTFTWSATWRGGGCATYLFSGALDLGHRIVTAPCVIVFDRGDGPIILRAQAEARFALLGGVPLDAPSVSNGSFVLSSYAALHDAVSRYRSGAMGILDE